MIDKITNTNIDFRSNMTEFFENKQKQEDFLRDMLKIYKKHELIIIGNCYSGISIISGYSFDEIIDGDHIKDLREDLYLLSDEDISRIMEEQRT